MFLQSAWIKKSQTISKMGFPYFYLPILTRFEQILTFSKSSFFKILIILNFLSPKSDETKISLVKLIHLNRKWSIFDRFIPGKINFVKNLRTINFHRECISKFSSEPKFSVEIQVHILKNCKFRLKLGNFLCENEPWWTKPWLKRLNLELKRANN